MTPPTKAHTKAKDSKEAQMPKVNIPAEVHIR